jgi:hypothetical protein
VPTAPVVLPHGYKVPITLPCVHDDVPAVPPVPPPWMYVAGPAPNPFPYGNLVSATPSPRMSVAVATPNPYSCGNLVSAIPLSSMNVALATPNPCSYGNLVSAVPSTRASVAVATPNPYSCGNLVSAIPFPGTNAEVGAGPGSSSSLSLLSFPAENECIEDVGGGQLGMDNSLPEHIPFVFEEAKASYFELEHGVRQALLSLGPMAPDRLAHIEKVHVVYQPLQETQITIARRLDLPHYQATTAQVMAAKFGNMGIYKNTDNDGSNASNAFMMYVGSQHSGEVTHLLASIDFHALGTRLLSKKPKHSVRQSYFEDFGVTSSQSTNRKGDTLGISKPTTKPGTDEPVIKTLLRTCSDILRALNLKIFEFGAERVALFSGKLAPGNVVEAMRLAITDEANLCGIHEDQRNDKGFPEVPVFSKFIMVKNKRYRVSIIMYSRQSISDYLKRKNCTYGVAVQWVLNIFKEIPEERRSILPGTFPNVRLDGSHRHGLAYSTVPCHMDPSFFISPVIHFGLMLAFTHTLNFAELVSIFRAWAAMPFTTYYFTLAVVILLQAKELPCRGIGLGRFLLILMKKLKDDDHKHKIPGLRFATYSAIHVPGKQAWDDSTTEIVRLCLEACFRSEPPGAKKSRADIYESTRRGIQKEIKGAGPLITNHLLAILAIVGLVPLWFAEEHTADNNSKAMIYLQKHQDLPKGKPEASRFLDSLSSALNLLKGITGSRKYAENVSCKGFRLRDVIQGGKSDERFSDLVFEQQCVFQVVGGEVYIHRAGRRKGVVKGSLIDHWAMSGRFYTIQQLLLQFGKMGKDDFSIPDCLGGGHRWPKWVDDFFPEPLMMKDRRKALAIIQEAKDQF